MATGGFEWFGVVCRANGGELWHTAADGVICAFEEPDSPNYWKVSNFEEDDTGVAKPSNGG